MSDAKQRPWLEDRGAVAKRSDLGPELIALFHQLELHKLHGPLRKCCDCVNSEGGSNRDVADLHRNGT
jgi:hypothetical protein